MKEMRVERCKRVTPYSKSSVPQTHVVMELIYTNAMNQLYFNKNITLFRFF